MRMIISVVFLLFFLSLKTQTFGSESIPIDTTINLSDDEFAELEKKLESEDPTFRFTFLRDNDISFFIKAQKKRPESFIWIDMINMHFASERYNARQLENEDEKRLLFENALKYLSESLETFENVSLPNDNDSINKVHKIYLLTLKEKIAFAALSAGNLDLAKQSAQDMLANNTDSELFNYGITENQAKTLLGCVALREKDIPRAKEYLLKSVEDLEGSDLSFFGPSFILAKELLEYGEKDIILIFLDNVANIWANPETTKPSDTRKMAANQRKIDMLEKWKEEIRSGQIPDDPMWQ
ncbi:hypothetical protein [Maribellus mangrovi]|uniref:hypothetical protein n=1 Tax=Maribellus mangrovi TaxID=3133146 RepID=UPI0030ED1640